MVELRLAVARGAGRCGDGSVPGPGSCCLPAPVKLAITDHLGASWFFLLGISAGSVSRSACSESRGCRGWSRDGTPLITARLRHVVVTACPRFSSGYNPTGPLLLPSFQKFKIPIGFHNGAEIKPSLHQAPASPVLSHPTASVSGQSCWLSPPSPQGLFLPGLQSLQALPQMDGKGQVCSSASSPGDTAGMPAGPSWLEQELGGGTRLNRDPRLPRGRVAQEAAEGCPCATAALLGAGLVALSTLCQHLSWPQSGSLQPKAFLGGSPPFPRAWHQGEMGRRQLGPGLEGLSTAGAL